MSPFFFSVVAHELEFCLLAQALRCTEPREMPANWSVEALSRMTEEEQALTRQLWPKYRGYQGAGPDDAVFGSLPCLYVCFCSTPPSKRLPASCLLVRIFVF
jgi:hypothetical protein